MSFRTHLSHCICLCPHQWKRKGCMKKELFLKLNSTNVNEYVEEKKKKSEKKNLTYLSWAWAWQKFMEECPDARYEVKQFDGKPYLYDESLGYLVSTSITVDGDTREMWLPVMDGANKSMKDHPYKYKVKDWQSGEYIDKVCEPASMFDINKTIMRCLVKNIAMFGLGLYIYAGEDIPQEYEEE